GLCVSLASVVAVQGTEGEVLHYAGIFHDITARKEDETRIWRQANFDALTGLPNRSMFNDRLDQAVTQASRDKARFAVAFVDLDGFKAVNDTLGHAAGDLLLKETAQRLKKMLRASDTVARLSGDEFTMILHSGNPEGVAEVARRLIDSLTEPFLLDGKPAHVRASVGIALFPAHGEDAESLLRRADAAMYRAKRNGKGRFEFAETEALPA
ncbi:MAG: GGDEF domain-containing protein, partial [Rhodospirillales bacterium]|nr:GGDEF domain-containing protein [Rhodospirillales bacterium]